MTLLWLLGPILGVIAFAITFVVSHAGEKKKRAAWAALVALDAQEAAARGTVGLLAGRASSLGQLQALSAPLSGRPCLAYHLEIITREREMRGTHEEITWRCVFEDAAGSAFIVGSDGQTLGRIDFAGAHPLLPADYSSGHVPGVTLFRSSSSMFSEGALPPHLAAFVANAGLPPATRDSLFSAGRNLSFNERIVVPDQPLAAAGPCSMIASGVLIARASASDVFFAPETARSVRARAVQTPIGDALWGASVAGIFSGIVLTMIVAFVSSALERKATRPASGVTTTTSSDTETP